MCSAVHWPEPAATQRGADHRKDAGRRPVTQPEADGSGVSFAGPGASPQRPNGERTIELTLAAGPAGPLGPELGFHLAAHQVAEDLTDGLVLVQQQARLLGDGHFDTRLLRQRIYTETIAHALGDHVH